MCATKLKETHSPLYVLSLRPTQHFALPVPSDETPVMLNRSMRVSFILSFRIFPLKGLQCGTDGFSIKPRDYSNKWRKWPAVLICGSTWLFKSPGLSIGKLIHRISTLILNPPLWIKSFEKNNCFVLFSLMQLFYVSGWKVEHFWSGKQKFPTFFFRGDREKMSEEWESLLWSESFVENSVDSINACNSGQQNAVEDKTPFGCFTRCSHSWKPMRTEGAKLSK